MASAKAESQGREGRLFVEGDKGRRPFMRGIMIHALMSRGAAFEEAFETASRIRQELQGRKTVTRDELSDLIDQHFTGALEERPLRPAPVIGVGNAESNEPFSKGVLAQSLLAAAVEPEQAHEVARAIEASLVARGSSLVEKAQLRELSAEVLERRLGPRVAGRYLAWREFLEDDRPLILLLAGAAGVGKSSLAQAVAHRLGVAGVTSTDAIRQVMRIMLGPELLPAIHASSFEAHKQAPHTEAAEDPVLDAFRAQASSVSVGARAMIDRAISENTSMILDGVAILPGLVDPSDFPDSVYTVFLAVSNLDEDAFRKRFERRGSSARPPHRYLENLDAILKIQDYILDLAEQHDVPIVDNRDFDASVRSILRYVTDNLRKQREKRVASA